MQYDTDGECAMIVDGVKCNSCRSFGCLTETSEEGVQLDCENIEIGAVADSCTAQALFEEGTVLEDLNADEFRFW